MDKTSGTSNKKANYALILLLLSAILLIGWLGVKYVSFDTDTPALVEKTKIDTSKAELSEDFIKAVIPVADSSENYVVVSDHKDMSIALDGDAGVSSKRTLFNGRRINIAVTGVDSRLGTSTKHADANHVISLLLDSGKIEIYSVPRDTYADCGYDDTTGQNKLTVLRAGRGREAYLRELARITRLDKIHYFVEFGFSQAMGLLEFLGYSEAPNTLQVLRSRRGLGGDDYQRVYNQAQFIKQAMIRQFDRFDGAIGSLLLRGVLSMVETNVSYDLASDLYKQMKTAKFPSASSDVAIYIRPPMPIKFKVYDFQNSETVAELRQRIENFNKKRLVEYEEKLTPKSNIALRLNNSLTKAIADTAKNPARAISTLRVLFDQRAWFQVQDLEERNRIRSQFETILIASYLKKKQPKKAEEIKLAIINEKNIFKQASPTHKSISDTNNMEQ